VSHPEVVVLHEGWVVSAHGGAGEVAVRDVPAAVPGCVHTDLLAAGLIPDPFLDDNELATGWVGRTGWCYRVTVPRPRPGAERVDLVCEGLDTVADLVLDGEPLASTRNMHRSYRFDVTDRLREGGTVLEVLFGSAWDHAEAQRATLGNRPGPYPAPYNFIRKMACSFGWDWGPATVTAGIWRPMALHCWSTARLAVVRPEVTVTAAGDGRVAVHVELERTPSGADVPLTVSVDVGGSGTGHRAVVEVPPGRSAVSAVVEVPDPDLWWPAGYGEPARHRVEVVLRGPGGELDRWSRDVGFRTVELDRGADAGGSRFTLRVNGVAVLVKGANWIPDDAFVTRVDAARYRHRVGQAVDCGINLLRVWGGGIYEDERFYAACDEAGVLVWQDFLFACAAYPEEEPLRSEVEAEARENVVRLMPHPSLVLWCGNNENLWGRADWGWEAELAGRTWGEGYYLDLLPRLVAELDPTRPYVPGSPSGPPGTHPNDERHGPTHYWDAWNELDWTAYRTRRPRFVAEFGWQAPPAWSTLRRSIRDEPMTPTSPGLRHHQKADDGNGKLARGLAHHFPEPADFDDWLYLTQVNQARAVTAGIEHFRSLAPYCSGTVVWQLNDCWPVTSWSAVDGDGRPKPSWFALRRAYAGRLAVVGPRAGGLRVALLNDTPTRWRPEVTLSRRGLDGTVLSETRLVAPVEPRLVTTLDVPDEQACPGRPEAELLVVTAEGGHRALWFFAEDRDIDFPRPDLEVGAEDDGAGGLRLSLHARTLVRDLVLAADRLHPEATVSDALLTLLPGERAELVVRSPVPVDVAALLAPPVLRTVNDAVLASRLLGSVPLT
jgi:beta-mannosidase